LCNGLLLLSDWLRGRPHNCLLLGPWLLLSQHWLLLPWGWEVWSPGGQVLWGWLPELLWWWLTLLLGWGPLLRVEVLWGWRSSRWLVGPEEISHIVKESALRFSLNHHCRQGNG